MDTRMILGFLGSLGSTEIIMVFVVVLILFGPKQLPQIAKTIGKGLRDIRRAANQLKHEVGLDELDEIYPRSRPIPPPGRATTAEAPPTGEEDVGAEIPDVGAVPTGHESRESGTASAELDFKAPPGDEPRLDPEIRKNIGTREETP